MQLDCCQDAMLGLTVRQNHDVDDWATFTAWGRAGKIDQLRRRIRSQQIIVRSKTWPNLPRTPIALSAGPSIRTGGASATAL
jgi:hypothetical protein